MFEQPAGSVEKDRSRLIVILSGIAVLVVIGLIILVSSFGDGSARVEMAGPGSPEFDSYASFVKLSNIEKFWGERLNQKYGRIHCFVQNGGERVITGLQLRGVAVGFSNEEFKRKVITPIPGQQDTLNPNQSISIDLYLEPIPDPSEVMDMKIELVGLKLK